jgi:hypothetical protein
MSHKWALPEPIEHDLMSRGSWSFEPFFAGPTTADPSKDIEGHRIMLRNVKTGKCMQSIDAVSHPKFALQMRDCDPSEKWQYFTVYDQGGRITRFDGKCLVSVKDGDVNVLGRGQSEIFQMPCEFGLDNGRMNVFSPRWNPYNKSPFVLQYSGQTERALADVVSEGQNFVSNQPRNANDTSQLWVEYKRSIDCQGTDIPLAECGPKTLYDCARFPKLRPFFENCPADYCKTHANEQRCIDWCKDSGNKAGVCDTIYYEWCKARPNNEEECGCLNMIKPPGVPTDAWALLTARPACMLAKCSLNPSAYKTSDMKTDEKTCAMNLQVCSVLNQIGRDVVSSDTSIQCSQMVSGATSTSSATSSAAPLAVPSAVAKYAPYIAMAALAVFLLIFLMFATR